MEHEKRAVIQTDEYMEQLLPEACKIVAEMLIKEAKQEKDAVVAYGSLKIETWIELERLECVVKGTIQTGRAPVREEGDEKSIEGGVW